MQYSPFPAINSFVPSIGSSSQNFPELSGGRRDSSLITGIPGQILDRASVIILSDSRSASVTGLLSSLYSVLYSAAHSIALIAVPASSTHDIIFFVLRAKIMFKISD